MPEFKFACPQCGQHLSGNEQWSGHQIQCPTCATALTVPQAPAPPAEAAPAPQSLVPQPPASRGPKLSAGATQVARPPAPGSIPIRNLAPPPPKNEGALLEYGIYAIVFLVAGVAAYLYVPSLLNKIQDGAGFQPAQTAPASTPAANSGGSGPLGEVNGAMDVSDALDGGSQSTPHPASTRKAGAAQTKAAPEAIPTARSTNDTARMQRKLPKLIAPAASGR